MNEQQYVNAILRGIKSTRTRKKDIRKQLEADIAERKNSGESIEGILLQMGSVQEVIDDFNENQSETDKVAYKRNRIFLIVGILLAVIIILVTAIWVWIPRMTSIEESEYFVQEEVESTLNIVIELLDQKDYEALQSISIEQMKWDETSQVVEDAKNQIATNWGEQVSVGTIYMTDMTQFGHHYAVCEVTVVYENTNVTYRITFDEDMRLAGLYLR
ncbi:MAG: DUF3887 domain-containing protein [Eubacteriales bacterium]